MTHAPPTYGQLGNGLAESVCARDGHSASRDITRFADHTRKYVCACGRYRYEAKDLRS